MDNSIKKSKVTILGAGYAGATIAYALMLCGVCDELVLVNRHIEKAQSEIDDIRHGFPFMNRTKLRIGDYSDCTDSDVIIIATGRNRKPGESRLDLTSDNLSIVKSNVDMIKKHYTNAVVLIVTNPIDIITQKVNEWMGLPYGKVFGTGCILDSSRFIRTLADYFNVDIVDIRALVIGEHGDGQVLLWDNVTICGKSIVEYCKDKNIAWDDTIKSRIENRVKNMGMSIIANKGRTQYGIATCTADIVNAVLTDKKITVSVSSPMQGEFGIKNVTLSYPSFLGGNGIEGRLPIELCKQDICKLIQTVEKFKSIF